MFLASEHSVDKVNVRTSATKKKYCVYSNRIGPQKRIGFRHQLCTPLVRLGDIEKETKIVREILRERKDWILRSPIVCHASNNNQNMIN